jgi:hypothetical protein
LFLEELALLEAIELNLMDDSMTTHFAFQAESLSLLSLFPEARFKRSMLFRHILML